MTLENCVRYRRPYRILQPDEPNEFEMESVLQIRQALFGNTRPGDTEHAQTSHCHLARCKHGFVPFNPAQLRDSFGSAFCKNVIDSIVRHFDNTAHGEEV